MPSKPSPEPVGADALVQMSSDRRRSGDAAGAADCLDRALALDPDHAGALTAYAMLLVAGGDLVRAVAFGRRAVTVDPQRVSAHHVLGQALCKSGLLAEGIQRLRYAARLRPDDFVIQLHLGVALNDVDDLDAAEECLTRAATLEPSSAAVHVSRGNLYRRRHLPAPAIAAYEQAIAIAPGLAIAHNNLGTVYSDVGDAERAIHAYQAALRIDPDRPSTWSNLLLAMQRSDIATTEALVQQHRAFGEHFSRHVQRLPALPLQSGDERRLRIGYVSSDFVSHAVAVFIEPLFRAHDRDRVEIHAYHTVSATDDVTQRVRATVEHFHHVAADSDDQLAARIRADGIDVLVDLNGHTAHNRLLMFMRKPAPVQVTWLGYLGTTGMDAMDYRLTDAVADPPGRTEWQHTETLWRLPRSQWCYGDYAVAPAVGPLPSLASGRLTFASLASPGKVSASAVRLWSRVLAAVPDARLLLIGNPWTERTRALQALFAGCGIAPERVMQYPMLSTADYLALYGEIDIALDTWPYSGGTTTCDALWMGVPVVTCAGERSVSRSAASMLCACGLPELVAEDATSYVARAVDLARDTMRLIELRATLRARLRASPLHDAQAFARSIEAAYVEMVARAASRR